MKIRLSPLIIVLSVNILILGCVPVLAAEQKPVILTSQSIWSKTKSLFKKKVPVQKPVVSEPAKPVAVPTINKVVPKAPVKTVPAPVPEVTSVPEPAMYTRPDTVVVRDIGTYTLVQPPASNYSIYQSKLFNNGEVFVSKMFLDKNGQMDSGNFIFANGVLTSYPNIDFYFAANAKGEKVQKMDSLNIPYFISNGKKTRIPSLGGNSIEATDINELGQVIGTANLPNRPGEDGGASRVYLWQNGVIKNLGALDGNFSTAVAINNKGQIVGTYQDREDRNYSFIWENGVMKKITAGGTDLTEVLDINDNGFILGKISSLTYDCSGSNFYANVYIKDSIMNYLDPCVQFTTINNSNEFVGTWFDSWGHDKIYVQYGSTESYRDFLNRVEGGCRLPGLAVVRINDKTVLLNDIVGDKNITFGCAKYINDRGEILAAGFNYTDGRMHEYLVSLPKNISSNIRSISETEPIEPRDPNRLYAQPEPTNN